MERKFVNESRYVKSSKNKGKRRRTGLTKRINNGNTKQDLTNNINMNSENKTRSKIKSNKKNKVIVSKKVFNVIKVTICVFLLLIVALVSRLLTKEKGESILPAFFNNSNVKENENILTIGIYGNNNLLGDNVDNIVLAELEQYIYPIILRVDMGYGLEYSEADSIQKISNLEYIIKLKEGSKISANDIKLEIENLKRNANKNSYKVENVDKIETISDKEIKIILKAEDEYFAYNLSFPIKSKKTSGLLYHIDTANSTENSLSIVRNEDADISLIKNIKIVNVKDENDAVQKYKDGTVDVIFSNSGTAEKLLGKYEYNIKKYKSGENIFMMFNTSSEKINKREIRQGIIYGIDREAIVKDVFNLKASTIDLPYIYDDTRYKYDIYASENLFLSNGYTKTNGVYYDESGKPFELTLVVNKEDTEKVQIAENIKRSLEEGGVKLNINPLTEREINVAINSGAYDMVLTTITLNENPNINYLKDRIGVNETVKKELDLIKESKDADLSKNIDVLRQKLSDNVAIFGIASKDVNMIYKKNIDVFDKIGYMSIMDSYLNKK